MIIYLIAGSWDLDVGLNNLAEQSGKSGETG